MLKEIHEHACNGYYQKCPGNADTDKIFTLIFFKKFIFLKLLNKFRREKSDLKRRFLLLAKGHFLPFGRSKKGVLQ